VISHDEQACIDPDIDEVLWLTMEQISSNSDNLRSELVISCINDFNQGSIFPLEIFRNRL
jgi:hypothetical protein